MKQSQYFSKVNKNASKDDVSVNARFLEQGGFIYKNSAGIYTYLPLGWRVIQKIANIIREEMNAISGQEVFMPALHDKHYLEATGRWDVDVVYKVISGDDKEPKFNISWTHEEIASEIAARYTNSYKDLPFAFYQIQTKFRHEPRAKSGLLRGREFMMKDLYSFHTSEEDLMHYYDAVKDAYLKIFERCGLKAYYTLAAGGEFTASNTHEFQVITEVGEDTVFICDKCDYAENLEVSKLKDGDACEKCGGVIKQHKAVEAGNIFPLGTKYSEAFDLKFTDKDGQQKFVVMGSYGIGLGRLMGTAVEVMHDDNGIIWPESIAPFKVHLISLIGKENEEVKAAADKLYVDLQSAGIEVLYDDRDETSAGQKFAESDLIGIPNRVVVSAKTLAEQSVELKKRAESDSNLILISEIISQFS
ncbi:MAG TPA: aminoacyl--tRNA ligase-related protein [Patescibacteria group bacterium]|jgi:prolyl-tRNA synthetase|nr:aminoacyl--tRNA ligase-related protein [Patescibacteria group bacterium]